jgi:membrane protease YdiL (CAAX protease family)
MSSKTARTTNVDFFRLDGERGGLALLLFAAVLYIGVVPFRDWIVAYLVPVSGTGHDQSLGTDDLHRQIASLSLKLPALCVIWFEYARRDSLTKQALRGPRRSVVAALATTVACSLIMNAANLWPFTWRWPTNGIAAYAVTLAQSGQWFTVVIWGVTGVIIVPFIEEVVFRISILRLATIVTGTPVAGVIISSALFAAGHLGNNALRPSTASLVNSAWLFTASLALGYLTVKNGGSIRVAVIAHSARNGLEFLTLLGVVIFAS